MADEIQPVTAGAGADFATDAAVQNGDDESGELVLHSGCQEWKMAQYKAEHPLF